MALGPAPLFCPADRPDRYEKAAAAADAVIIDLEDAVAPAAKASARESLIGSRLDPARTIVRLNPVRTAEFARDLEALQQTPYRTVMLAKAEEPGDLEPLALEPRRLEESPASARHGQAQGLAPEPHRGIVRARAETCGSRRRGPPSPCGTSEKLGSPPLPRPSRVRAAFSVAGRPPAGA